LPSEPTGDNVFGIDPLGRFSFDAINDPTDALIGLEFQQYMKMIIPSIDDVNEDSLLFGIFQNVLDNSLLGDFIQ